MTHPQIVPEANSLGAKNQLFRGRFLIREQRWLRNPCRNPAHVRKPCVTDDGILSSARRKDADPYRMSPESTAEVVQASIAIVHAGLELLRDRGSVAALPKVFGEPLESTIA